MTRRKQIPLIIGVCGLFGVTLLLYMFFPLVQYQWNELRGVAVTPAVTAQSNTDQQGEGEVTGSEQKTGENGTAEEPVQPESQEPAPEHNEIRIEKIGVQMKITEGDNEEAALDEGAWRFTSPAPGEGKNVALAGHRYKYRPPSSETFYLLDKLEPGDEIIVWWNGKKLRYRVDSMKEVSPQQVDVVDDHGREELTLVTCAPLFSNARRLIITAYPVAE